MKNFLAVLALFSAYVYPVYAANQAGASTIQETPKTEKAIPNINQDITQEPQLGSGTFTNAKSNYSITFPENWKWQENFMRLDVFGIAPPKSEAAGSQANISVISIKIDGDVKLDALFDASLDNIKKTFKDIDVVDTGKATVGTSDAQKVVYKYTVSDVKYLVTQYFLLNNNIAYIITCTTTTDDAPNYKDAFDQTLKSFKLQ